MFELVSVNVVSLIFTMLLLVVCVDVRHLLTGKEILYYKLSKTVSFFFWVSLVLELKNISWRFYKIQFIEKFISRPLLLPGRHNINSNYSVSLFSISIINFIFIEAFISSYIKWNHQVEGLHSIHNFYHFTAPYFQDYSWIRGNLLFPQSVV